MTKYTQHKFSDINNANVHKTSHQATPPRALHHRVMNHHRAVSESYDIMTNTQMMEFLVGIGSGRRRLYGVTAMVSTDNRRFYRNQTLIDLFSARRVI